MTFPTRKGSKHFIGSSGGNAGMAMAVAAKKIGKEIKVLIMMMGLFFTFLNGNNSKYFSSELRTFVRKLKYLSRRALCPSW